MKNTQNYIIVLLCAVSLLFMPVAAITTGDSPGVQPTGKVQTSFPTSVPTQVPTPVQTFVPPVDVSQNVGFLPIWLIIGVILIIIALTGLLWRYFHPKYVPPEEKE
jgi:hypothetical protein